METNSSEVTQAAEFAAAELSQQSNSLLPLQLEEVSSHLVQCTDLQTGLSALGAQAT